MKIIGCDLHAAQQTIAMLDRETGERSSRRLCSTRAEWCGSSTGRCRHLSWTGLEVDRFDGVVSPATRRAEDRVSRGPSGDHPQSRDAQAETRSTRCGIVAATLTEASVSGHLDPLDRAAGSAGALTAIGTNGCACGRACNRRCTRSSWVTVCSAGPRCESRWPGDAGGGRPCPRTPPIAAMSSRR